MRGAQHFEEITTHLIHVLKSQFLFFLQQHQGFFKLRAVLFCLALLAMASSSHNTFAVQPCPTMAEWWRRVLWSRTWFRTPFKPEVLIKAHPRRAGYFKRAAALDRLTSNFNGCLCSAWR